MANANGWWRLDSGSGTLQLRCTHEGYDGAGVMSNSFICIEPELYGV